MNLEPTTSDRPQTNERKTAERIDPANGQEPPARKATRRLGPRELRWLQNATVALICVLLFFLVFRPYFLSVRNTRDLQTCQSNMFQIARALSTYATDWDGAYPPADSWMDNARGNMTPRSNSGFGVNVYFHCPLDKSGKPSSYAYNELMAGLQQGVQPPAGSEMEARLTRLKRLNRAALVIERHGSEANAHLPLDGWDAVRQNMTLPHMLPEPTGNMINGALSPERRTAEQLNSQAGKGF